MNKDIKLSENGILRFRIVTSDGKPTGEYLEFDVEDMELPLRYQNMSDDHIKNSSWLKQNLKIIEKRQDSEIKGSVLTTNERDTYKILNEFYHREQEAIDKFLGKDGCKKLLNGRKPYLEMFNDIANYIEPLKPIIEKAQEEIGERLKKTIKESYQNNSGSTLEG